MTKCLVCEKQATDAFKPFCSQRCADVDLGRWLTGTYRVETNEAPETASAENPKETYEN